MCEIPPIRMLVLTLTGRCNFKCLYCYASEQDPVDMTEETAIAAVALAHVYEKSISSPVFRRRTVAAISFNPESSGFCREKSCECTDADTNEWSFAGERHWKVAF